MERKNDIGSQLTGNNLNKFSNDIFQKFKKMDEYYSDERNRLTESNLEGEAETEESSRLRAESNSSELNKEKTPKAQKMAKSRH